MRLHVLRRRLVLVRELQPELARVRRREVQPGGEQLALVDDLVGEERSDDGKDAGDDLMLTGEMAGDGRGGEELEGEVLNGGLRFAVGEQVGINDSMVYTCEVGCYKDRLEPYK